MVLRRGILLGSFFLAVGCNFLFQPGGNPPASTPTVEMECRPPVFAPTGPAGPEAGTSSAETNPKTPASPSATISPTRTEIDPRQVLRWLCDSNVYDNGNPMRGKTVRFAVPIAINPNGSAVILTAIRHYEKATGGLVKFEIIAADPPVGITVIEGDAVASNQGKPGCGNVTSGASPTSGHRFHADPFGVLNTLTYVHLGSSACDDEATGYKPESVAEHELAHALGLGEHFPGFTGDEGLSPNLAAVITKLYSLPPGTDLTGECATQ